MAKRQFDLVRIAVLLWGLPAEASPAIDPATVEPNALTDDEVLPLVERNLELPINWKRSPSFGPCRRPPRDPDDVGDLNLGLVVQPTPHAALEDRVRSVPECIKSVLSSPH